MNPPPEPDHCPEPWEMQPGEPAAAFAAFVEYRDAGPGRSLAKLAKPGKTRQNEGLSLNTLEEWSSQWQWVSRTRKWVAEVDRIRRESALELLIDMQQRHIRAAHAFLEAVTERLEGMEVSELKPADLARWFEIAVKVERLSLGEETDIVGRKFRDMSDEDLMDYLRHNVPAELLPEAPLSLQEGEAAEA